MNDLLLVTTIFACLYALGMTWIVIELMKQRQAYRDELRRRPIGHVTRIEETEEGLKVEGQLHASYKAEGSPYFPMFQTKTVEVLRKELQEAEGPYYILNHYFKDWMAVVGMMYEIEGPIEFATEEAAGKNALRVTGKLKVTRRIDAADQTDTT